MNLPPSLPRADRQTVRSRTAPAYRCDQFMFAWRPTGKESKARCGRGPR